MDQGDRTMTLPTVSFTLGDLTEPVRDRLAAWEDEQFSARMWAKDHTLWSAELVPELVDRLGWLWLPDSMRDLAAELPAFADEIAEIADHVVLCGMGGSSLAPEVYQSTFGNAPGRPELIVLDSTHPGAVHAAHDAIDPARAVFIVASKSGGTLETMSFFRYFWAVVSEITHDPGQCFIAITDPGSGLEQLATERGFRRIFLSPPDVGGRYSALTPFGLVPAALIGVDVVRLLDRADDMAAACGPEVPTANNPGLKLGAALGEAALAGRDKVTYAVSPKLAAFPGWVEQLVAESTGKDDKGIVPVAGEPVGTFDVYGSDRLFIHVMIAGDDPLGQPAAFEVLQAAGHPIIRIVLDDVYDLGAEFYCAEVATAAAGSVLGIQPFDQPDVQIAKDLAKQAMSPEGLDADISEVQAADPQALAAAWVEWMGTRRDNDYVSIQAYVPMGRAWDETLDRLQAGLRDKTRCAVTLGYGPRFLHSTGQLHKGGADNGLFLQIVTTPAAGLVVPETDFTFDRLVEGQAAGDYQALMNRGRRVLRVNLGTDVTAGLDALVSVAQV